MLKSAPESPPRQQRVPKGRIITFYSYKGGTGRSMAVANVAWMLALSGERVLIVDWDLEAPGIHRYFHPFLEDKELVETEGLLDFVEKLAGRAAIASGPLPDDEVDIVEYITILHWPANSSLRWDVFGPCAGIDLLVAGRQGPAYGQKLNAFNWIDFYEKLGGRRLLDIARQQMRGVYDYILIDSRTGVSDTSGICTVEMPDTLVVCFTLNDQSIKGASGVIESVQSQWRARFASTVHPGSAALNSAKSTSTQPPMNTLQNSAPGSQTDPDLTPTSSSVALRIFPVPTRVEIVSERAKREVALALAQRKFSSFIDHLPRDIRNKYWLRVQLPYFPFYAFEEIPAVFGDPANDDLSLSTPLRHIARYISDNSSLEVVPLDKDYDEAERLRKEVLSWYVRKGDAGPQDAVQLAQTNYDQCDRANQLLMRKVMLRLVQAVAGSTPSLATVPREDFDPPLDGMVQMLDRSGLVQISGTSVFLADRKIVESWDLLRQWLREDADFLLWRQKLTVSARSWRDHSSDESALLRGPLLTEAIEWLEKRPDDLTRAERDFIIAGRKARDKDAVSWRRIALRAVALGVFLALVVGWYIFNAKQKNQQAGRAAAVITLAQQYVDKDPLTSALLLSELPDYQAGESDRTLALKVAQSTYPEAILRSDSIYNRLEFSRDGKHLIAAGDQGAELWDASTWKKIGNVGDKSRKLISASFNAWAPDKGKQPQTSTGPVDRIVTTDTDGIVQVWTLNNKLVMQFPGGGLQYSFFYSCRTQGAIKKLTPSEGQNLMLPIYARFSPDDAVVIVAYKNGILVMVSPDTGLCFDVYNPHSGGGAVFSPDGEWAATMRTNSIRRSEMPVFDAEITMFHVQDWKQSSYKLELSYPELLLAVSVNSFVMIGVQRNVLISNPATPLDQHLSFSTPITFTTADLSRNGNFVGIGSYSGVSLIFSPQENHPPNLQVFASLHGHSDRITHITFDPSSTHILTASADKTVRIWPVKKNPPSPLASWQEIVTYLRNSTKVCFTPEERMKLLNESQDTANTNARQCGSSHN